MNKVQDERWRWLVRYWRPAMAWQYFCVCVFDFLLAPFIWSAYEAMLGSGNITQWHPISLESGGLYHLSMGAIIGVSAWSRTLEKIEMIKRITEPSQPQQSASDEDEEYTEDEQQKMTNQIETTSNAVNKSIGE